MKKISLLFVALVALLGGVVQVQAAGYVSSITTAYPQLAINPSAPQVVWAPGSLNVNTCTPGPSAYITCDDGISQIMDIGFTFNFAGTAYSRWSMTSNGVIFFETNAVGGTGTGNSQWTPSNLPTTALSNPTGTVKPALMPFWADLQHNPSAAGANNVGQPANASFYQYEVQTVGAKQVLVIQLMNVKYWNSSPVVYVNMQIQLWSSGEIAYSYGNIQVMTSNPNLRIGLQYPGGGCNTLANQQSASLSNQSYVFNWDTAAAACPAMPTVNHYEISHDGAATLCAEAVTVLACTSGTTPCPAVNIVNNQIINASVNVTGTGTLATPTESPSSFNIQPTTPQQTVNLTWAAGTAGTATLGLQAAVTATGALTCTNVARTASRACTMTVANTACVAAPHHFQIQGPASGTTCGSSTFTIKAWADAAQTSAYTTGWTGTLTQTGNPASLPSLGAFTIPNNSSTVSITPITFPLAGTTTFSTSVAPPALAGATTCLFGASTSCAFTAASCVAGFNCVETAANAAVAADANPTTGRLYTKLASTAFTFDVVSRKADGTVDTTYASDIDRPVTVELVNGSGTTVCASRVALNPAVTSQTLTFLKTGQPTDQGRKSITFTVSNAYADVRCRATDTTNAALNGCSLDDFAIRPSAVTLNNTVAPAANAAPPPAAGAATNTPIVKAGASFTLQATTGAGTNYQGSLTLDTAKLSAQTTAQVTSQAAGGTMGTLTPSPLVANPATLPTSNATYSEVGYLYLAPGAYRDDTFTAVDNTVGDCVTSTTSDANLSDVVSGGKYGCSIGNKTIVSLGRFVPDHFDTAIVQATAPIGCPAGLTCPVNCPAYAPATCPPVVTGLTGMMYSGQPFTVRVTAKNLTGATTLNYQTAFAKVNTLSAWSAAGGAIANPGSGTLANTGVVAASFASGVAITATPTYTLASATAPTDVYFRSVDADTASTSLVEAGLKVAKGRTKIANAHGSELLSLPMTMTVQYWNGASWLTSATDSSTSFNSNLSTAGGNIVATIVSGLGGGVAITAPGVGTVAGGVRSITLSRPGVAGSATLGLNAPAYLLPNVAGRATFGVYKGNNELIYMRENY